MPLTPAKRKANDKYIKSHYTQVKLSMPNDEAAALDQFCNDHSLTKAGFIRSLIREAIATGYIGSSDLEGFNLPGVKAGTAGPDQTGAGGDSDQVQPAG